MSSPALLLKFVFARGQYPDDAPDVAFRALGDMTAHVYGVWEVPDDDTPNRAWVDSVISAITPLFTGFWTAQSDLERELGRARRSFRTADWDRLVNIRSRYDPDGLKTRYLESP